MLNKMKQFSFLIILIILYSCNTESIAPTKTLEQPKSEEVGSDYKTTESGINITMMTKELETKLKNYFKLDKINKAEYPILLTRMFLEQYKEYSKNSSNSRVNQDDDQIFCLTQVTMNSITYSSFQFGIYSDNYIFSSRNLRDKNMPIGTYIESYVVRFPVGQQNGIILNQSLYTVNTNIICPDNGDELAAAKAYWSNQNAITSSLFHCDD